MEHFDEKFVIDTFRTLLSADSTTGMHQMIQDKAAEEIEQLGFTPVMTHKGGVMADLGGEGDPLVIAAHLDVIGLMVRKINRDGTLKVCRIGGLYPANCTGENVRIYTGDGRVYTGTICRSPNSIHVTENEIRTTAGDFDTNICVVLDEPVRASEDTRNL